MRRLLLRVVEGACASGGVVLVVLATLAIVDALLMSRVALAGFDGADGDAIAVLEIERLDLRVPVFADTARAALRRGSGAIAGTALPGESGKIGIAGHRDSFFRPLEHIEIGDALALESHVGVQRFRVTDIRIVDALDTSVLEPSANTELTLVTCYPFRYVGFAPDRFIVHAALVAGVDPNTQKRG